MPRYKLLIQYDGTNFAGWQVQPTHMTIQEMLETNASRILGEPIKMTGSGRTDAGVHAKGQVAHFDTERSIDLARFLDSLNGLLPHEIRVLKAEEASPDFHALFSAKGKVYHYHISLDRYRSPFQRHFTTHVRHRIDLDKLKEAARCFVGTHDFTSFANSANEGAAAKCAIRTIKRIDVVEEPGGVRLEFEGNGFLYKMVRNITGMLLDVARGKRELAEIEKILRAKDRRLASKAAPAQGLILVEVFY